VCVLCVLFRFRVPKELAPSLHVFYPNSCLYGLVPAGTGLPLMKTMPDHQGKGEFVQDPAASK
jgi:hypothetical protein